MMGPSQSVPTNSGAAFDAKLMPSASPRAAESAEMVGAASGVMTAVSLKTAAAPKSGMPDITSDVKETMSEGASDVTKRITSDVKQTASVKSSDVTKDITSDVKETVSVESSDVSAKVTKDASARLSDKQAPDHVRVVLLGTQSSGKTSFVHSVLSTLNPDKSTKSVTTYECDGVTLIDTPDIEFKDNFPAAVEQFMTETKPNCVLFFYSTRRRLFEEQLDAVYAFAVRFSLPLMCVATNVAALNPSARKALPEFLATLVKPRTDHKVQVRWFLLDVWPVTVCLPDGSEHTYPCSNVDPVIQALKAAVTA